MGYTPEPVNRLIDELSKLPGIGPRTASRLAFYVLKAPREQVDALSQALLEVKDRIQLCSICFNITERDPCALCTDPQRDRGRICVVEDPLDVIALERTGSYKGLYHVLHGTISPMEGIGPDKLRIKELVARAQLEEVEEVILATNPNLEGEATAMYIARLLGPVGVRVTRLARGLPVGSDLEYADEITLTRALEGRREM